MSNIKEFNSHYEKLSEEVRHESVNPYLKVVQKRYRKYIKKLNNASEKKRRAEKENKPIDADTLAAI